MIESECVKFTLLKSLLEIQNYIPTIKNFVDTQDINPPPPL